MRELSAAEIAAMKRATPEQIHRSQQAQIFVIEDGKRRLLTPAEFDRRAGRPRKPPEQKEKNHVVRFSDQFLELLKVKASKAGYPGWQTYLKAVLAREIGFVAE